MFKAIRKLYLNTRHEETMSLMEIDKLDGVFLSSLIPLIEERIANRICLAVGELFSDSLGLCFDNGILCLSATPDSASLWWVDSEDMGEPASPSWKHHIKQGRILSVTQPGADRILHIDISSTDSFGGSPVRLVFEATGRNSNIILLRVDDGRILACLRRISKRHCRYRTIAPGQIYIPPPKSGLSPGTWADSGDVRDLVLSPGISPLDIYKILEGVGPVTAKALLQESAESGTSIKSEILKLEKALLNRTFSPWMGPDGPLPVRLGQGEPILDPLAPENDYQNISGIIDRRDELIFTISEQIEKFKSKLSRIEKAENELIAPEKYRIWGQLLLNVKQRHERGADLLTLTDWDGTVHDIPLKTSKTVQENADRYFRKAANINKEKNNLRKLINTILTKLRELQIDKENAGSLGAAEVNELLRRQEQIKKTAGKIERKAQELLIGDGWRCFYGRNAGENDEVTFNIGVKGDIWLHARGVTGAHVILKMDGRSGNPPTDVMNKAAAVAAKHSSSSGVVPVDYTYRQYVRRIKKGGPGKVTYTREKTIFVEI